MEHGRDLGNLVNFTAMPLLERYIGVFYENKGKPNERPKLDELGVEFRYDDGTSDSYVKRGFDEERIETIARTMNLEQSYRIFTTNTRCDFKPYSKVMIGDRLMTIVKVLPLLNTNDSLRMYNFDPTLYRDMAVKLIFLE